MIPLATLHPDTTDFQTRIKAILPEGAILDESYFYPTGGGQPNDTGTIAKDEKTHQVTDVRKHEQGILHVLDTTEGLAAGDAVTCAIDAERRMLHRRMHTAMHVLCAVLERAEGTRITGNSIGTEKSRLDVDMAEYSQERIQQAVEESNRIIAQDLKVIRRVVSREEFLQDPSLVKLAAGFPEHIQEVHLVEIEGFDKQACGGTHVDHLGQIGQLVFLRSENRGKSNRRVYFALA